MMKSCIIKLCTWCSLLTITASMDKPRYQPELDQLMMDNYITNETLFNSHINCLLFDGPCDSVGRWMKPRIASYLLGACILCTLNQEKEADKFMTWLYEYHPQLFRMGIEKYLDANGITLPEDSKFKELVKQMNVPKVSSLETSEDLGSPNQINQNQQLLQEQPGIHQNLQQPQQNNQPHHQQQQLRPNEQQATFSNQRTLNPNSRKHKFSAGMNAFSSKTRPTSMEDDEADMEVTVKP